MRNGNKLAPLLDTVGPHGTWLNMARHGWTIWDFMMIEAIHVKASIEKEKFDTSSIRTGLQSPHNHLP